MEKPKNVLETGGYVEPYTFENESEAILFSSYLELLDYIKFLENKMNYKELLKPRFEVIADYPYPKNHCYYKVGEIINTITEEDISYCRKYPHLFRELKCFEHRNQGDLKENK